MAEYRPQRDIPPPNSLLRAIKLWYVPPALLHSPDGHIKILQRFVLIESGDIFPLLPVAGCVPQARGHKAEECRPVSFGAG